MDLPTEIRLLILQHVFRDLRIIWSMETSTTASPGIPTRLSVEAFRQKNDKPFRNALALLSTARLLRQESLPIFKTTIHHVMALEHIPNFPKDHIFFQPSEIRHLSLQQKEAAGFMNLPNGDQISQTFPNLATLTVQLPNFFAASLRGSISSDQIWNDPQARKRLLQLLEVRDCILTGNYGVYAIGDELRRAVLASGGRWSPEIRLYGNIGLPPLATDYHNSSRTMLDGIPYLAYHIDPVSGQKSITFDDGTCLRISDQENE